MMTPAECSPSYVHYYAASADLVALAVAVAVGPPDILLLLLAAVVVVVVHLDTVDFADADAVALAR